MVDGVQRRKVIQIPVSDEFDGCVEVRKDVLEEFELSQDVPKERVDEQAARDAVEDEHLLSHCCAEGEYDVYYTVVGL